MKRKWLLLLALACCVMLAAGILAACHKLPAEQPDANLPTPSEGLEYGINNDGQSYEVTGIGECEDTALVIPQTYNGLPVTSIGACAFENCTGLISVTIPDSVTSIGRYAFSYCSGLTSVIIPDSVTSIGEGAFQYCFGLTSVIIGKGVTSIGDRAFYYCSDLTSVIIPDSVTSIGDEAFSGCSELESITVEEGNSVYYSAGNCLIETASKTLIAGCKTSIIPDDGSVTSIGRYAFYNCSSLTSITIPDSVTSIGWQAFLGCSNITSATMPTLAIDHIPQDSLQTVVLTSGESIGRYAFYDSHLTSVTIPDSVTSIGSGAFEDCWGLTSITIPDSVTSIGYDAFSACYKLVEVYNKSSLNIVAGSTGHGYVGYYAKNVYKETGGSWFTDTEDGFRFFYDGKQGYLMEYNGSETEIDLPTSFTAYDRTLVKSYTIYKYAFYNCSSLTSVTIPDSVTSIGDWAFAYCDGLTSIAIPDSVTSIERGAFEGCRGLTSITIPDTVTSIGDYAFRGCSSLESITIPFVGATKDGTEDTHFGYIFGASDYSGNGSSVPASLKEVIITGGTRIGFSAFSGCSSLTSIAIPDSVTSIGEDAFA